MPLLTTLTSLSQTPASNAADGSVDAPSTMDNQVNLLAAFIAQLRDGNGFTTGAGNVGQCRLTKSGVNLLLSPFMGNGLTISGVIQKIPLAGVTLAPGALSAGTLYYIYAYMVSTVMTLEASTIGHSTDVTTGVEIKTSDSTRTLVGMARPIAGPAWSDILAQRFVVSWFNRKPLMIYANGLSNVNVATPTPTPVIAFMEFLTWGDVIAANFSANVSNNTANAVTFTGLALDSSTTLSAVAAAYQTYAATSNGATNGGRSFVTTEGYHFIYTLGYASSGTGTWSAGLEHSGVTQG